MDGEFGRLLGWIGEQGLKGLAGLMLISLPVVALAVIGWLHRLPHLRSYWLVPVVTRPAAAAGVLLGWSVLYSDPYAPSFRVAAIFESGGVWDIPWPFFLRYRGDPGLYSHDWLLPAVRMPDADPVFAVVLLAAAALLVIAVIGALLYLRGLDLVVGLIGVAFLCLLSQAITIYVTALAAYTFNTLNFWSAAVALGILQYYRRVRSHRAH